MTTGNPTPAPVDAVAALALCAGRIEATIPHAACLSERPCRVCRDWLGHAAFLRALADEVERWRECSRAVGFTGIAAAQDAILSRLRGEGA